MKKDLFEQFNGYLANLAILTFKLHNLHWNEVGAQFVPVHLYTEEVYNETFEYFDQVAELFKFYGETPDCKLSDYLAKATIKEVDAKTFKAEEALGILLDDLKLLNAQATELRNASDAEGWFTSVATLEAHIASYTKRIWFLTASLA